jgi:lysophospholipase L1-like esterase
MKKVFFYGDSNTYGYDPSGMMGGRYPRRSRWTTILAESLEGEWDVARDGMPAG